MIKKLLFLIPVTVVFSTALIADTTTVIESTQAAWQAGVMNGLQTNANGSLHLESTGSTSPVNYVFTNCNASGRFGPTQAAVNSNYSSTNLNNAVTVIGQGIQQWIVPQTGNYTIEAIGASGGGVNGGYGAKMKGDFLLNANDTLMIIAGQTGFGATDGSTTGGGASFVVVRDPTSSTVTSTGIKVRALIIAGGGGGNPGIANATTNANITTNGSSGTGGTGFGPGGINGNGGSISVPSGNSRGGGGGGFLTNGLHTNTCGSGGLESGRCFLNGGEGGLSVGCSTPYEGGFGGGAGSISSGWRSSGGGGGYSGGGGGQTNSVATNHSGGGGGSINYGTNQTNALMTTTGNGKVTLTIGGPVYLSLGNRISPVFNFSKTDPKCIHKSEISWNATVPTGSSLTVDSRFSTDGGNTWSAWQNTINGGPIPGLSQGMALGNLYLQTNIEFANTSSSITPELHSLKLEIIDGDIPTPLFSTGTTCVGQMVQFSDQSSITSGTITGWSWDFGNSNTAITQNPTSTYPNTGNYNVELTVTSDKGCTAYITENILIDTIPVPGLPAGLLSRCQNADTDNYISVVNNASSYIWTITGSNNIDNSGTVVWDAAFHGTAEICVSAINGCGTSGPACIEVVVNPIPETPTNPVGTLVRCQGPGMDDYVTNSTHANYYTWTVTGNGNSVSQVSPNATVYWDSDFNGIAEICIIAANGCGISSEVCVNVLVNPLPGVNLHPPVSTKFCINHSSVDLTGSPAGGVFSGNGITGNTFDPGTATAGTHTITYTFTDPNGCENSDSIDLEVDPCTGTDNFTNLINSSVFPNPAKGNFVIELNEITEPGLAVLFNFSGKMVWVSQINLQRTEVNIDSLAPGIYFLQVNSGKKQETHKLVISK